MCALIATPRDVCACKSTKALYLFQIWQQCVVISITAVVISAPRRIMDNAICILHSLSYRSANNAHNRSARLSCTFTEREGRKCRIHKRIWCDDYHFCCRNHHRLVKFDIAKAFGEFTYILLFWVACTTESTLHFVSAISYFIAPHHSLLEFFTWYGWVLLILCALRHSKETYPTFYDT